MLVGVQRQPRTFDPARFDVVTRRLRGGFYTLRVTDRNTGKLVPQRGAVYAGRASVHRAIAWSTDRYLGRQP